MANGVSSGPLIPAEMTGKVAFSFRFLPFISAGMADAENAPATRIGHPAGWPDGRTKFQSGAFNHKSK